MGWHFILYKSMPFANLIPCILSFLTSTVAIILILKQNSLNNVKHTSKGSDLQTTAKTAIYLSSISQEYPLPGNPSTLINMYVGLDVHNMD